MTIHFAYPNVVPKKKMYIGCGRYTVFSANEDVADEYCEVRGAPNTPNKKTLKRTIQLLAAESFDSTKALYHKQDRPEETYQGDSLDLAWFLAHILRARKLRRKMTGDIWCTGVIQINGSPHLFDVDACGFTLKLKAFLDPANKDTLFIVPLANKDTQVGALCRDNGADFLRLTDDASFDPSTLKKKTILAVPADGLTKLLDILFLSIEANTPTRKRHTRLYLLLLILVAVAGFGGKPYILAELRHLGILPPVVIDPVPPLPFPAPPQVKKPEIHYEDIVKAIEQGDFSLVPTLMQADISDQNQQLAQLKQQITRPLIVGGTMEYRLSDGTKGKVLINQDSEPPTLTHQDYYRLRFDMKNPPDAMYLYLFQVDSDGNLTAIFPANQFDTKNPVRPWQWPITIPTEEDKWIILDTFSGSSQQQTREIIYLLATPWPARDIEELAASLDKTSENDENKAKPLGRLSLRQQADIPAITCLRWSFFHGR